MLQYFFISECIFDLMTHRNRLKVAPAEKETLIRFDHFLRRNENIPEAFWNEHTLLKLNLE